MTFQELCDSLTKKIQDSYESGISQLDAEKLAGEFLYAQIQVSSELKKADLDARMKKSGNKAIRAGLYLDILQKNKDKKPTEAAMASMIDSDKLVEGEQASLDLAEVIRDDLERFYNIFQNAHVHFRSIAKGSFGS